MKTYNFFLIRILICFSLIGCYVKKPQSKPNKIQALKIYNLGPDIFATDFYDFKIDSLTAIKIDRDVIYLLAPVVSKEGNELIYDSSRARRVFIYNQKDEFGYFYDSLNSFKIKRYAVDSFLSHYTPMKRNPFLPSDTLVGSTRLSPHVMMEKYVPKVNIENNYDTLFVTFDDRLKNDFISLSESAEMNRKLRISKLAYFTILENQRAIWWYWEIKEDANVNSKVFIDFITRHKSSTAVSNH